jgi:serine/threonine protein kinase
VISVGSTVGNYQVVKQIGAGAMGNVFLAQHPVIGKCVAVKVIHPNLANNEEMLGRFFNEARAVTQIGHENIVEVQDFGQTPEGDSFIVMELLEGESLGDRLKREGALPVPRAVHVAIQIADGLAAAHARGIIHRDLKPDNIFLINRGGDGDFVKILDFGLAKLTGPGQSAMGMQTKTGSLLGTPHYMAPEQAENIKKVDHRADVYSLGCMFFQILTGRVPFPGEGFGEVLVRHVREPPPLPSRLNPAVPPALEKIVLHALAKKPDFRFASMDEFRAALRDPDRFARSLEGQALHVTPDAMPAPVLPPNTTPPFGSPPVLQGPIKQIAHNAPTLMAMPAVAAQQAAELQHVSQPSSRPHRTRRAGKSPLVLAGVVATTLAIAGTLGWLAFARSRPVTISIVSTPSGAEVREGDNLLGTAPVKLTLERSSHPRLISVRKDGFVTAQRSFVPDKDVELAVRLIAPPPPEPEPAVAPPPPSEPVAAAAPPPAAAPAPSADPEPAKDHHHHHRPKANPQANPHAKKSDTLILAPSF